MACGCLRKAGRSILETGNDSWRLRNSTAANKTKARIRAKEATTQTTN